MNRGDSTFNSLSNQRSGGLRSNLVTTIETPKNKHSSITRGLVYKQYCDSNVSEVFLARMVQIVQCPTWRTSLENVKSDSLSKKNMLTNPDFHRSQHYKNLLSTTSLLFLQLFSSSTTILTRKYLSQCLFNIRTYSFLTRLFSLACSSFTQNHAFTTSQPSQEDRFQARQCRLQQARAFRSSVPRQARRSHAGNFRRHCYRNGRQEDGRGHVEQRST